jgi:hypothetical protein
MSIIISHKNNKLNLIIGGCYKGAVHEEKKELCECEFYVVKQKLSFGEQYQTPALLLFMELMHKRAHCIDNLLDDFTNHFSNEKYHGDSGVEYMKKIILEFLENNVLFARCNDCYESYLNCEIGFNNILYVSKTNNHDELELSNELEEFNNEKCVNHRKNF